MTTILSHVPYRLLEEILDDLDAGQIDVRQVTILDWLDEFRQSADYYLYDAEIRAAIDKMCEAFTAATGHPDIFDDVPGHEHRQRVAQAPWMRREDRDRELATMRADTSKARTAYIRVLTLVRERHPEVSLNDLEQVARNSLRRACAEAEATLR